jgi:hypothetical protein
MWRVFQFVCLMAISTEASASTILFQTFAIGSSVRFSDGDTAFRSYDNFALTGSAIVERVGWSGLWIDLASPVPAPAGSQDAAAWEVAFYADSGGQPGALLSSQTIASAGVQSTFLGTGQFSVGQVYNVNYFSYLIDLPLLVGLSSGTPYWLSVYATGGTMPQNFAWLGASGGNGFSWQSPGGQVAADRQFQLEGTVVPEPGTMLLLATGGLVMAFRRRL